MSQRKYVVYLSEEQRQELTRLTRTGVSSAHQQVAARVLLQVDRNQQGRPPTDKEVAASLSICSYTVQRIKMRFLQGGLTRALESSYPLERPARRKLGGAEEAQLVCLACSAAPDGRQRWSMQLLADKLVELHVVERISKEAVRQVLKKTNYDPG